MRPGENFFASTHNVSSSAPKRRSARLQARSAANQTNQTININTPLPPPANMDPGMQNVMSLMTFMLSKVTKLDQHNYNQWKLDMELRLISAGLWNVIAADRPANPDAVWIKNEATVLADIRQNCESSARALIMNCRSPKDAWNTLKAKYERNTDENKNRLWGEFNIQMKPKESMQDYITRMKTIVSKLKDLEEPVPDGRIVDRLVHGLVKPYTDLGRNLRLQQRLTLDDCENIMLMEEKLYLEQSAVVEKENVPAPSSPENTTATATYELKCNICGRRGHIDRDCRVPTCTNCGKLGHSYPECWNRRPVFRPANMNTPMNMNTPTNDNPNFVQPYSPRYSPYSRPPQRGNFNPAGWNNNGANRFRPQGPNNNQRDYSGYQNNVVEFVNGRRTIQNGNPEANMAMTSQQWNPEWNHPEAQQHWNYPDGMAMTTHHSNPTDGYEDYGYPVQQHDPPDFDHFAQMAIVDHDAAHPIPTNSAPTHLWLVDSGATNHYTAVRSLLHDFQPMPPVPILTGRGHIFAKGVGHITIRLPIGLVTVRNVMWIPDLTGHASLLSVPQLAHNGCKITFEADVCQIYKGGYLLASADFNGKAYYLDVQVQHPFPHHVMLTINSSVSPVGHRYKLSGYDWFMPPIQINYPPNLHHANINRTNGLPVVKRQRLIGHPELAMLHGTSDTQPIEVWHKRLGHLNLDDIKLLTTMATGIDIGSNHRHPKDHCISCLHGKQHRQICRIPRLPADSKLEIVHIDIKGPCDTDVNGFRYWANFMCEKTRFNRGYPLQRRSDVFRAYLAFEAVAERESGAKVLSLMMDGGGENLSSEWRTHCTNHGIKVRLTAPYSPEMNGLAERLNRVLTEHASTMLWEAQLPMGFWAAAMSTANFLRNRSPTSALDGVTPFQAWYGKKPNLGFIRVFGCKAMVHTPQDIRSKTTWDSHTTECMLNGFSDTENLFELWDIGRGASLKRRDVIFFEDQLGCDIFRNTALKRGLQIFPASVPASYDDNHIRDNTRPVPASIPASYAENHIRDNPRPVPPIAKPVLPLPRRPPQQTVNRLPSARPPSHPIVFQDPVVQQVSNTNKYPEVSFTTPLGIDTPELILSTQHDTEDNPELILSTQHDTELGEAIFATPLTPELILSTQHGTEETPELTLSTQHDTELGEVNMFALMMAAVDSLSPIAIQHSTYPYPSLPHTYHQAISAPDGDQWLAAMHDQLKKLQDANTWDLIFLPAGRRPIANKWVFSKKDGAKAKPTTSASLHSARLVARGDLQTKGVDYDETFAPVVKLVSLRMLLAYAAFHDLDLVH